MNAQTTTRLAWALWVLSVMLAALTTLFYSLSISIPLEGRDRPPPEFLPVLLIAVLVFSTVGALVASRRPENAIGRIFCVLGVTLGAAFSAKFYAGYSLIVRPGSLPGGGIAVWSLPWTAPVFSTAPTFVLLLFPDGRLLSHRWRPVAWLAVGAAAMSVVGLAFQSGTLDEDHPSVTNPFGIGGRVGEVLDLISSVGAALATVALLLSLVSMVVRFWRSRVEEHQQIKWIAYAGAIMITAFLLTEVVSGGGLISDLVWAAGFVALVGLPIVVGVAILKYRLYDMDVVINRTLVYGSLTVTLALTYSGSVALLQYLLRTLTAQETQLTVVASTLAIAALFQPLRRRIQEVIDRRLYRRKYDAAKTLEAFGARLREETDLDRLGDEMVTVVRATMQPEHVSLWLKPAQMAQSHARAAARAGTAQR